MKKILMLLFMVVLLCGCVDKGTKIMLDRKYEPAFFVKMEHSGNKIKKIYQTITYEHVNDEDYEKAVLTPPYNQKYVNEDNSFREGIIWRVECIAYANENQIVTKKEVIEIVKLDLTKVSEKDKELLEEDLKLYDFDDYEKTRKNLEKAGVIFE